MIDVQGNSINEGTDVLYSNSNDDVTSEFYNYDDMIGAKLISSSDVSHVIFKEETGLQEQLMICTNII